MSRIIQLHERGAKRYSLLEQEKILAYVAKVNGENGRGGATAAAKKFGVTRGTISRWLGKEGTNSLELGKKERAKASQKMRERMAAIRRELADLKAQHDKLKRGV